MRKLTILSAAVILSGGVALAQQDPLEAAVEARQSHMELQGMMVGVLGGMARGNMEYDAETAQAAADNLAALASMSHRFYWPEGTAAGEIEDSRALPAIWENPEEFQAHVDQLDEAAAGLVQVAGDGLEAMQAGLGPVGQACGSCHEDFRQSDN
ncbi:c-type cytochrome [Wenxinia marina]|uniref:Cytochrome c556 n=1 Tax=Wenxinia marina DSM 24838 TaxID=1123501 RepID=A0A0D0Q550_9RHOB|nr:cytochrome c [Wenxinia marina]KIQ67642.1 Cytochrome c556 [Wenxinia marina DSM 24838]GGL80040.1 cytochrome c-554 [Wenxinia marina]